MQFEQVAGSRERASERGCSERKRKSSVTYHRRPRGVCACVRTRLTPRCIELRVPTYRFFPILGFRNGPPISAEIKRVRRVTGQRTIDSNLSYKRRLFEFK